MEMIKQLANKITVKKYFQLYTCSPAVLSSSENTSTKAKFTLLPPSDKARSGSGLFSTVIVFFSNVFA